MTYIDRDTWHYMNALVSLIMFFALHLNLFTSNFLALNDDKILERYKSIKTERRFDP